MPQVVAFLCCATVVQCEGSRERTRCCDEPTSIISVLTVDQDPHKL